jgi:hypothetical protein
VSVQERESLIAAADERVAALEDEKEGIPLPYLTLPLLTFNWCFKRHWLLQLLRKNEFDLILLSKMNDSCSLSLSMVSYWI